MIKIEYGNKFLKDLKKLKHIEIYFELRKFCFELLPEFNNLSEIHDIKKIIGYKNLYRIRIGNYRIGFRYEVTLFI
ncbi:MAG: type II toxin-antitoxin system RelE/ParE family toxin [bacterium]